LYDGEAHVVPWDASSNDQGTEGVAAKKRF
jgi:hypothetical protein